MERRDEEQRKRGKGHEHKHAKSSRPRRRVESKGRRLSSESREQSL